MRLQDVKTSKRKNHKKTLKWHLVREQLGQPGTFSTIIEKRIIFTQMSRKLNIKNGKPVDVKFPVKQTVRNNYEIRMDFRTYRLPKKSSKRDERVPSHATKGIMKVKFQT